MTRTYTELRRFHTLEDRFDYLRLSGSIGDSTFGFDRWMNQMFYKSAEWRRIRDHVRVRDQGCDLGLRGHEIFGTLHVHHMNPLTQEDIEESTKNLLDPEFLICASLRTHNAIHFGDKNLLPQDWVERTPGDTTLWGHR